MCVCVFLRLSKYACCVLESVSMNTFTGTSCDFTFEYAASLYTRMFTILYNVYACTSLMCLYVCFRSTVGMGRC